MTEQEIQLLYEKGQWVSGISKEEIDSTTKTALFYALYCGPVEEEEEE